MRICVIGSGNMGGAFIRLLSKQHEVVICDQGSGRGEALAKELGKTYIKDSKEAIEGAEVVILAVKPKDFPSLSSLVFKASQTVVSLLSGITIATIKKAFTNAKVVRLMPNTALLAGEGILGFSADDLSFELKNLMDSLFFSLGLMLWIKESQMEAFAALAASSPAFVFVLIESMIDSGIHMGFSVKESKEIVLKVLEGCVALLRGGDESLNELKWQITSPGGTTIAGLKALEESGFRADIWNAIEATYQKSLSTK